jgi:outer membrane protein OmpA-like peptidoglycan-associated protein
MQPVRVLAAIAVAIAFVAAPLHTQAGPFDKLKKKVKDKTDEAVEKSVDKAADKAEKAADPKEGKGEGEAQPTNAQAGASAGAAAEKLKPGEGAWANYDFKPGDRVLFADDFTKDEVGDFPRRFELVSGTMETVEWEGGRWLRLTSTSKFKVPLGEVLPERYTMEFDFAVPQGEMWVYPHEKESGGGILVFGNNGVAGVGGTGPQARSQPNSALHEKVAHARVMADGQYVKLYVNDKRLANIPNFDPGRANKILFYVDAAENSPALFGNFRIASGGKKLYDALSQKGRVATQGIYFDTGSDHVRPESSPTLKEISSMLKDHADLKLLIEGHTDNAGSAESNQTLSEKRAGAVRQILIESYGVEAGRLTAKGLGAAKPVAPNETPEGRQNNRRVELVKG